MDDVDANTLFQERINHLLWKKNFSDSTKQFSETDIIKMLEIFINNILLCLMDVGISIGTNCAPLPTDSFLYSHEADFIQGLVKKNEKKIARSFNVTFRYIDDVLSLNNFRLGDFFDISHLSRWAWNKGYHKYS